MHTYNEKHKYSYIIKPSASCHVEPGLVKFSIQINFCGTSQGVQPIEN